MEQFKTCGKCQQYSRSLLRCKLGKVNPRTKKNTKSAMEYGGISYICTWSKWKMAVAEGLLKEHKQNIKEEIT